LVRFADFVTDFFAAFLADFFGVAFLAFFAERLACFLVTDWVARPRDVLRAFFVFDVFFFAAFATRIPLQIK